MPGRTSVLLRAHDRTRLYPALSSPARGVDMCASISRLHRVYVEGGAIVHDYTRDRATTWERAPAGGSISTETNSQTVPTIYCDRRNRLWAWWHNDAGAHVARSNDLGDSWKVAGAAGVPVQAGGRWPRGCDSINGPMAAIWQPGAGEINVYRMKPLGEPTIYALTPFYQEAIPEQLVEFEDDRRNQQRMIWSVGAETFYRIFNQEDPGDHIPRLLTGDERVFTIAAFSKSRALHAFWIANVLHTQPTDNTMSVLSDESPVTPPGVGTLSRHHVGICRDHFNWYWLIAQQDASTFLIWYSKDGGASWKLV